jgi:di/tricarboxylate transporter
MIATGCLNPRQAARAVDLRIYLLIGSALALGTALQTTGGAMDVSQAVRIRTGETGADAL